MVLLNGVIMEHFGNKLKELVENTGISKKDIAASLDMTPAALSSLFSAENTKIDTIYKICSACNVKPWQFLASLETGISPKMFEILVGLEELPIEQQIIILRMMRDGIMLAKGVHPEKGE